MNRITISLIILNLGILPLALGIVGLFRMPTSPQLFPRKTPPLLVIIFVIITSATFAAIVDYFYTIYIGIFNFDYTSLVSITALIYTSTASAAYVNIVAVLIFSGFMEEYKDAHTVRALLELRTRTSVFHRLVLSLPITATIAYASIGAFTDVNYYILMNMQSTSFEAITNQQLSSTSFDLFLLLCIHVTAEQFFSQVHEATERICNAPKRGEVDSMEAQTILVARKAKPSILGAGIFHLGTNSFASTAMHIITLTVIFAQMHGQQSGADFGRPDQDIIGKLNSSSATNST